MPHKWTIAALVGGAVILTLLVVWRVWSASHVIAGGRFGASGPTPVGIAVVSTGDVPVIFKGLGTVTPLATVTVRSQINGQLVQIAFHEGQMVKAGDFLAEIDPRPYQAALEQAEGALLRDQALLKEAQIDLARYQGLAAEDSIATQQVDTQQSLVHQYEGTLKADQAQIDMQKLNLVYCHVTAPVSGRVGLRQVDIGNYVQPGDANGIVVITELQPVSVIFSLPEDEVPTVIQRMHAGATLPVAAYDRNETTVLGQGQLAAVDNQVDATTGTVKLRALFDNKAGTLFPNQFVNAVLTADVLRAAVLVPSAAVQRGVQGTYVYLVKADSTVAVTPVTLGASAGQNVVITAGLTPGDKVVVDGVDRLRDGAQVITPSVQAPSGTSNASPKKWQSGTQKLHHRHTQDPGTS